VTAAGQGLDAQLADAAQDRTALLAQLAREAAKQGVKPGKSGRFQVVRQYGHKPDEVVSAHRWEWWAEVRAYARTASHSNELGVHYAVLPRWSE
jgi:hypothetical protein